MDGLISVAQSLRALVDARSSISASAPALLGMEKLEPLLALMVIQQEQETLSASVQVSLVEE